MEVEGTVIYYDYTHKRSGQEGFVLHDGTDIYFARQLINERIQKVKGSLPPGIEPAMGPVATGLGEIFLWTVESDPGVVRADGMPYTPTDFRTIQDWIIRPQLRNVPGVADVNTIGGYLKEFHVTPDPAKLIGYGLTIQDVVAALGKNNSNVGAGYIERSGEQYLIRAPGQVRNLQEIRQIVIGNREGVPISERSHVAAGQHVLAPKGPQHTSPGQSEAASAAPRRPG